jgi:D-proline reductase (dithiol) PrdB
VALVTTAGVHRREDVPFDMTDQDGDPSYREIPNDSPLAELTITHDYYDHTNADRDVNIVFPLQRLQEFYDEGLIGGIADTHYSFMGHIDKHHVKHLIQQTAPAVARKLKGQPVDVVLLTPA